MSIRPSINSPFYSSIQHVERHLSKAWRGLSNILLPQDCFLCGSHAGSTLLCAPCFKELPRLKEPQCASCGLPLITGNICGTCLVHQPDFDATLARFRYAFPIDRLVQALKYQHHLAIARFIADAMLEAPPQLKDNPVVMATPLSRQRLQERGFNQALEIARPLAHHLGLPLISAGVEKVIHTPPQANLPWKERQKNIRGAFECRIDLTGRSVIVVDDVMTTGATLNELARTVKKHGATHVTNWVCSRAVKG